MTKLEEVRRIARRKGISGEISVSTRPTKKYMIRKDDKLIHFGARGMSDFLEHKDEARRQRFRARFGNNPARHDRNSPLFYSWNLLW